MTERISCYDCRFFSPGEYGCPHEMRDELLGEYDDDNQGECRRYPLHYRYGRTITHDAYVDVADWPKVHPSDWCGEFKRTESIATTVTAVPENHSIETTPKQNIRKKKIAAKGKL